MFAAIFVFSAFISQLRNKRSNAEVPLKWTEVGKVSNLYIYPLKSGKAVMMSTLTCTESGVASGEAKDRMFLVIDANGKVKSGREYPRLTLVTAEVHSGRLKLSGPDCDNSVEIDVPSRGDFIKFRLWDATGEGIDCGDTIADWLTKYLHAVIPLRLLYRSAHVSQKDFNPGMKKFIRITQKHTKPSDAGLFSDTFSYHLISESSIKDLNSRMTEGVITPLHFRPNIVVRGEMIIPFEEDRWSWIKIGDVVFQFLAPCMRCSFTTIDPVTGDRDAGLEPIATLKRYRLVRDEKIREVVYTPTMGIYLGARGTGEISVGDAVSVPETL